jgi:sulfur-carrier protein
MPVVRLYANLRKLAGTKELSITGTTVRAALNELIRQNPTIGEVILENSELCQHIILTLNGHNITNLETPVTEQDIIAIFTPIAGGSHHSNGFSRFQRLKSLLHQLWRSSWLVGLKTFWISI